mgnify:CR=1 FL=1
MFWQIVNVFVVLIVVAYAIWFIFVAPALARRLAKETNDGFLDPRTGRYQSVGLDESESSGRRTLNGEG